MLPKGLIHYVVQFAKIHHYVVTYSHKSLYSKPHISLDEILNTISFLDLPFEPHDYQIDSIKRILNHRRVLLVSPTGSGKSLVLYILIRFLLYAAVQSKKKILLIVPTTNLVEQMYTDFESYSLINKWNVSEYVHRIYEGHAKETDKPVIISTWQSLGPLPPAYFEDFMAVFGDEAHLCTAKTLQSIIGACVNGSYRVGTTGTIQDTKSHRLTLEGLFGGVYQPTTTQKLIEEKKLSAFEIKCILLEHPDQTAFLEYRDELEYLFDHHPRNAFIRNLAMHLNNNTLILYDLVEKHGMILKQMLDEVNVNNKKKIYLIYGQTPVEEVQRIRAEMETRDDIILLASYKKFQMGANIRNLHNIIFASPSKNRIKILQSIGRELRLNKNKTVATLFDIADVLCYYEKPNYTLRHFGQRIKIYNDERFKYKLYKVTLK